MSREFKTPPPFVRCDECGGIGEIEVEVEVTRTVLAHAPDCDGSCANCPIPEPYPDLELQPAPCPKCSHSPLPGWIPQWYTPEQWVEYVRRENDLPEYELPDDMPVFIWEKDIYGNSGYKWGQGFYKRFKYMGEIYDEKEIACIIHTDAGRPPADWRPE